MFVALGLVGLTDVSDIQSLYTRCLYHYSSRLIDSNITFDAHFTVSFRQLVNIL